MNFSESSRKMSRESPQIFLSEKFQARVEKKENLCYYIIIIYGFRSHNEYDCKFEISGSG